MNNLRKTRKILTTPKDGKFNSHDEPTINGFFDILKFFKVGLYTKERLKKHWDTLPLPVLKIGAGLWALFAGYQRLFVTTIDVKIGRHRFEMPSKPTFIDLRCPRRLKLHGRYPEPMIDLDNRYRLMRGDKPLTPEGCPMEKFQEFDNITLEEFNKYIMQNI